MKNNLMPLKLLVISLGLLLLGGFAILVGTLFSKLAPAHCENKAIDLPVQGKLVGVSSDPKNWRLTVHTGDGGVALITIDACTGALVSNLTIK